jgi:ferredoxin-nitrate reductase
MISRDLLQIRAFTGPLTQQLVQRPADFGLGQLPERLAPAAKVNLVCGFCATGCSLTAHLRNGQAVNLSATSSYPVNVGMACPKGWEALTPLDAPDRGTVPLLDGKPVSWGEAAEQFSTRMKDIIAKHGPDSVAILSTGQIVTEEMAYMGAFAKFAMGVRNIDSNTRQCMATSHVAYKQSFGFDAPPYSYQDFEESDVIILIGSNLCIAHPIIWQRVLMNRRQPKIVVIDPRRTETAMAATHHYAIQPKSDLTFLYGLARELIAIGAVKRDYVEAHTTGYAEFAQFLQGFDLQRCSEASGIAAEQIQTLAQMIANHERVSFWWTMGVNQGHESTRTAQAIINLALMTGNIGRPGTGANSITGQCNAMGSRLFANATSLIGGHDPQKPEHRAKVARVLGIDEEVIPREPGLAYDQIMDGVAAGRIKALWVVATNTAHSWINSRAAKEALSKLEFLCVQDMYPTTDTAKNADLFLPAAGWGEKEGTLINAERRIGLVQKVRRAPGQALSDFSILRLLAEAWGAGDMFRAWSSPEAVFGILQQLSEGQPCDITGVQGYAMLQDEGGVQWPLPKGQVAKPAQQRRLFEDGRFYHADGRAKFLFDEPRPMPEQPSKAYPMILLTGRGSSAQWHTNTRTGKSAVLRKLHPSQCYVELHAVDAAALKIADQQLVTIASARGKVKATAVISPTVQRGQCYMPMHYEQVNELTFPAFDPYSRQPSYKACAVSVAR